MRETNQAQASTPTNYSIEHNDAQAALQCTPHCYIYRLQVYVSEKDGASN
ncbi:MAG TPA: hypothetical protein VFR61_05465 [Nitrososphaeraceae archaeon]|nr:hypothetical protein [Nitrososphaeraceae archaeon]